MTRHTCGRAAAACRSAASSAERPAATSRLACSTQPCGRPPLLPGLEVRFQQVVFAHSKAAAGASAGSPRGPPVKRLRRCCGLGNWHPERDITDDLVLNCATKLREFPHLVAREYHTGVGDGDLVFSDIPRDETQHVGSARRLLVPEVKALPTLSSKNATRDARRRKRCKARKQAAKYANWWIHNRPLWKVIAATYNNLDGLRYVKL